ncbi:tyrosine-type recombinase/integrase [Candidatus Thioglobus sp.]|uniref:tyrosine-type recombinase/integrase n=1 Tax=Candidatus Thioglobus sp. TaxID=2026721 RepID=UPI003D13B1CE
MIWRDKVIDRSTLANWNNYHRHFKALFQVAVDNQLINDNIFKSIKIVGTFSNAKKTLHEGDIATLKNYLKDDKNYFFWDALFDILYYTGIRRRQLIGLRWKDLDYNNFEICLSSKYSKTKREYRVPVNPELLQKIDIIRNKAANIKKIFPSDQVFNIMLFNRANKQKTKKEMDEEYLSKWFLRLSKKTGIKVSPHRFRHTMATKIANNGGNIIALQNILGHSNITTTLGYVHADIKDMRKVQGLLLEG